MSLSMIRSMKLLRRKLLFILFLPLCLYSQTLKIKFEQFSIEDGMSFGNVKSITQDSVGFLWLGTRHGLNRYDGYEFKQYLNNPSDPNSLSDNQVEYLFVDRSGTLWVCTINGLNKYDNCLDQFIHYKHDPNNPNSLAANTLRYICQDRSANYWILSETGDLSKVDKSFKKYSHYKHDPSDPNSLPDGMIRLIYLDSSDNLWLAIAGTEGYRLTYFDVHNNHMTHYEHIPGDPTSLGEGQIHAIYEDKSGTIWIGADGLNKFNKQNNTFTHFRHDPSDPYSLSDNSLNTILEDSHGDFWIGTARGFNRFDQTKNKFYSLKFKRGWIRTIYEGKSGVLWIGTFENTLLKYNREDQQFPQPVFHEFCSTIIEDHTGQIWTGNINGLNKVNRDRKNHTVYKIDPSISPPLPFNRVYLVWEDKQGVIWVGTGHGLYEFGRSSEIFKKMNFKLTESNLPQTGLINKGIDIEITSVEEDSVGNIWIGTVDGIYRYNKKTGYLKLYRHDPNDSTSLHHNFIRNLVIGKQGNVWVFAQDLHRYDPANDNFIRELSNPNIPNNPGHNQVIGIHESDHGENGTYWIATEIGLFKYNRASEKFTHYTLKDGLPHVHIRGIREDDHGNLWIITLNGITRFDHVTETFKNYNEADGLQGNYYFDLFRNKKGEMIASGRNGISLFHPDSIKDDPHIPPIVLTRFKIFNKEAELDSAISQKKRLILAHDENMLSFEFAALNFTNPPKNQFAYKMEGFDRDWLHIGQDNHATYTNLPPGDYVFRVKGSNHDGVWNEEGTSLRVTITFPWWRSTWAYIFYLFVIASSLLAIRRLQINRLKMRYELEMEHLNTEKLHEVDRMKTRFYTNISHEFRTPLTLILGPLEKIISRTKDKETRRDLGIMRGNSQRLYQLINQLLDLSKLEAGRMKLKIQKLDIIKLANRCVQSFESQAKLKNIQMQFEADEEEIQIYIDQEKMENVCYNLISNALKFTPEGGEINITVGKQSMEEHPSQSPLDRGEVDLSPSIYDDDQPSKKDAQKVSYLHKSEFQIPYSKYVTITVSDTGPGISPDRLERIFDRFYQVDESITRKHEGSGIGLALTKELVELHHGKITLESRTTGHRDGSGSTFTVCLLLGKDHFAAEDIFRETDPTVKLTESDSTGESPQILIGKPHPAEETVPDQDQPLLLIVEDNTDLRNYLSESLQKFYKIIEAQDGKEGLEKGIEEIPDLVISDVMMPEMDGFELCKHLKTDERTNHIPVVLLTARADAESKIEGLETGADDYLPKPFDIKELNVRIKNLIEQRQKLREKYAHELTINPSHLAITSANERFLNRALEFIEEHLSDSNLSVEEFGKEIGMSRVQLHRKLKALTTLSATEFIRTIRLKHAARLIDQNYGNVAEIAYEVGFNSPSYFAECFQKQFGKLPSKYST